MRTFSLHSDKALACLAALLLLCCFAAPEAQAMGEKSQKYMVGFRTLGGADKTDNLTNIAVWYPSRRPLRSDYQTMVGPWEIRAEKNVRPAEGLFPVILFSHDMARNSLDAHDLCSALAEAGFVVIAPTHFGDNERSANALYSAALYYHRPRQLVEALAAVTALPDFAGIINTQRVGLLGSGSGAASALQLAGADLAPEGFREHCAQNPQDQTFCGRWPTSRHARLPEDAAEIRTRHGKNAFKPALPNIRAVGLLAPGGLFMLNSAELARIQVPIAAVFAENDELYPPPTDNDALLELFPAPLFNSLNHLTIDGVDHYSLSAPCPGGENAPSFAMCGSASPSQRARATRDRDNYFITFFKSGLGVPLHAPLEASPETPPE